MNATKRNEELLREASAFGDEEGVRSLIEAGADINSQHSLNGWTALHWAAKRGHSTIVKYLLSNGADPSLKSLYGESAFAVAKNEDIRDLLSEKVQLPDYKAPQTSNTSTTINSIVNRNMQSFEEELVLKIRTSDPPDQDFIEIEIPLNNLSYENVFRICCEELQVLPQNVQKLRKLPNTIVRKDKDVQRLQNFQEMELVMVGTSRPQTKVMHNLYSVARLDMNGLDRNNSDDMGSPLVSKSNYCKNGTILY